MIGGIGGGEGVTTLAAALHGHDAGRYTGEPVDVLVCRPGTLTRAAALPGVPVLVVVADGAVVDTVHARLRDLGARAVVVLPHVARWPEQGSALVEARALLGLSSALRPRDLGGYVTALLAVTDAVVGSGVLRRAVPATRVGHDPGGWPAPTAAPAPARPGIPLHVGGPIRPVVIRIVERRSGPVLLRAAPPPRPLAGTPRRLRAAAPVPAAAPVRVLPHTPAVPAPGTVRFHDFDDDALETDPHRRPLADLRTG